MDEDAIVSAKDRHRRLVALEEMIKSHPGQLAELQWTALRRSAEILGRNISELLATLDAPAQDLDLAIELFQNVRSPDVREDYYGELHQRLHNLVASAASLIDHTRRHVRKHPIRTPRDLQFVEEYERRKNRIKEIPVAVFVKDLRDYLLHYRLPVLGHTVSLRGGEIARDSIEVAIQAPTDALLNWRGWDSGARSYIRSAGEVVDVRAVVTEYGSLVQALYSWMFQEYLILFEPELGLVQDLRQEYRRLLRSGRDEG